MFSGLVMFMVALCNRADHYIFILFLSSSSFFFLFFLVLSVFTVLVEREEGYPVGKKTLSMCPRSH